MDYKKIFLSSNLQHDKDYRDLLEQNKKGLLDEVTWVKKMHSIREKHNLSLNLVVDDFIEKPPVPVFVDKKNTTGNNATLQLNGNILYSDKKKYEEALHEYSYTYSLYKIDKVRREYANKLGVLTSDFLKISF